MTLLRTLGRFGLLTAEQLTRLHTPTPHGLRSMQRRLKRLVDTGLLRLQAHPTPRYGSAPYVFTLGQPGRVCLAGLGLAVPDYFRPGEQHDKAGNVLFLTHALAVGDVLINAAWLARDIPAVSLGRLMTEQELRHSPLRVASDPDTPQRTVAVIPDAWFQLHVSGDGTYSIALELDRGSEHVPCWQAKVAALTSWATAPYQQAFDTDNLTIAIVTPTPARRDQLADWTQQALTIRGQPIWPAFSCSRVLIRPPPRPRSGSSCRTGTNPVPASRSACFNPHPSGRRSSTTREACTGAKPMQPAAAPRSYV